MDTNTLRAWRWLRSGDTGLSSETIWSVMMGEPPPLRGGSIPYDPADFGRCHQLLALFPEWRARLPEVEAYDPMWGPLVREWDALTALYLEELPTGQAPKLWARMQALRRRRPVSITPEQINNWFTYHPPTETQRKAYERIREVAKAAAIEIEKSGVSETTALDRVIEELCPDGWERQEALRVLCEIDDTAVLEGDPAACEEAVMCIRGAVMWANAAIACAPAESVGIAETGPA